MKQELFIAVIAGFGGMLGWGFADFFAKKTINEIGDMVTLAWGHVFGTLILFSVVLYQLVVHNQHVSVPSNVSGWSVLMLFGLMQAVVYLLLYKGFGKGQVAILNPIFASFAGLTVILSIVIYGEVVNGYTILALATLFVGILLISIDLGSLRSLRVNFAHIPGLREVVCATLLAALWTLFWGKFIDGKDWLSYALLMYTFMTIVIIVISIIRQVNLFTVTPHLWKFLILIGVGETVAYIAISLGYSTTPFTSIIALLSGAFSLPTIILARIFLKEKVTTTQTVGSLVIVAGIMFLSLL